MVSLFGVMGTCVAVGMSLGVIVRLINFGICFVFKLLR